MCFSFYHFPSFIAKEEKIKWVKWSLSFRNQNYPSPASFQAKPTDEVNDKIRGFKKNKNSSLKLRLTKKKKMDRLPTCLYQVQRLKKKDKFYFYLLPYLFVFLVCIQAIVKFQNVWQQSWKMSEKKVIYLFIIITTISF